LIVDRDTVEDRRIGGTTLVLTSLATITAESAIAGPERPLGPSLAWTTVWVGITVTAHRGAGGFRSAREETGRSLPGKNTPLRPLVVITLLAVFALPFASEAARLAWSGRAATMELVLIAALRNLGLGLAALARRPAFARLAALVSLFLVLVSASLAGGPAVLGLLGLYAGVGSLWLVLAYWQGLHLPHTPEGGPRVPRVALLFIGGLVGLVAAVAAVGPSRAATVLAGLVPSSGGTSWNDPEARSGVNDGENEVNGSEKPQSIGYTDSDVYLESDQPSLYDAFNEFYGEPVKPRQQDRVVAIDNRNVIEQRERPAENLQAGRRFSAVRQKRDRPARQPSNREAKALFYAKGPTPLHLGLAAYDRFDGREWVEEAASGRACPIVRESDGTAWFRFDSAIPPIFAGTVSHQFKVGTLDSSPLPVPAHLRRFRVGQVDRPDFFGWSHEGMLRMVGRTIPAGTVIESEALTPDPSRLRELIFPAGAYASDRLPRLIVERPIAQEVRALALAWSKDWPRGWGQVEAVVSALRQHAAHDRRGSAPPDCDDVVSHFLFRSRCGPDYQFATAAAVLLRALDYPTRLKSGFYAAPHRYNPRTSHTSITHEDVHVWTDVRLPDGTWVAIEPTPGYELMAPAWSWTSLFRAMMATTLQWTRSHSLLLILAAAGLATLVGLRCDIADALATLVWRTTTSTDARRCVIKALHLVERRSTWAGRPRPCGQTPRRWYESITNLHSNDADDLQGLIQLADWGLHAPPDTIPPCPLDNDPRETCRRAVAAWTLHRFRTLTRTRPHKEIMQ